MAWVAWVAAAAAAATANINLVILNPQAAQAQEIQHHFVVQKKLALSSVRQTEAPIANQKCHAAQVHKDVSMHLIDVDWVETTVDAGLTSLSSKTSARTRTLLRQTARRKSVTGTSRTPMGDLIG